MSAVQHATPVCPLFIIRIGSGNSCNHRKAIARGHWSKFLLQRSPTGEVVRIVSTPAANGDHSQIVGRLRQTITQTPRGLLHHDTAASSGIVVLTTFDRLAFLMRR